MSNSIHQSLEMSKRLISHTEQFLEDGEPISPNRAIALYEQAVKGDGIAAFTPEALRRLREVKPFQAKSLSEWADKITNCPQFRNDSGNYAGHCDNCGELSSHHDIN